MDKQLSPDQIELELQLQISNLVLQKLANFAKIGSLKSRGLAVTQEHRNENKLAEAKIYKLISNLRQQRRAFFEGPYKQLDLPQTASAKYAYTVFKKKKADLEYQLRAAKVEREEFQRTIQRFETAALISPDYEGEMKIQKQIYDLEDRLATNEAAYRIISMTKPYNPKSWFNWLPSFLRF